jgi:membrane protease YdiL (CAAX protease family)
MMPADWEDPELIAGPGRRVQIFELLVFLFLIVPSMAITFFLPGGPASAARSSFVFTAWATILRDLALMSLIFFFIWRNRESRKRIGWSLRNGWGDIPLGAVLFVLAAIVTGLVDQAVRKAGFSQPAVPLPHFLTARDIPQFVLAGFLVLVVAVAEETIFRGYLILRLKAATGSTAAAVLLSTCIFMLGHGYEGTAGMAAVGTLGLLLALVYVNRGSLAAPIAMHFIQDFIGVVIVPLLMQR